MATPDKSRLVLLVGIALLAFVSFGVIYMRQAPASQTLHATFPVGSLNRDGTLLDPANTDSVWHYYLLENLAVGLIRDDVREPSGFQGALASRWFQQSPQEWRFELRAGLRWSDGQPMSGEQIAAHFERLSRSRSRHLQYLPRLSSAQVVPSREGSEAQLALHFSVPTDQGLPHELSLADAALVHPDDRFWKVTSGPYSVRAFDPEKQRLILVANKNSPLYSEAAPQGVELAPIPPGKSPRDLFRSVDTQLYLAPPFPFLQAQREALQSAPQHMDGTPSAIYFFHFNASHPLTKNPELRRAFSALIHQGLASFSDLGLQSEHQMIPRGYSGRIDSYRPAVAPLHALRGQKLILDLLQPMDELDPIFSRLRELAKIQGVDLDFRYRRYDAPEPAGVFAHALIFQGNQKDSLGSWSFLFAEKSGQLSPYRSLIVKDLDAAVRSVSRDEQLKHLRVLHQKVLDQAIAVPFLNATSRLLAAANLDLSRLNPFDLRPRYYEIRFR